MSDANDDRRYALARLPEENPTESSEQTRRRDRDAGRNAGRRWAARQAEAGYRHPVGHRGEPGAAFRVLIIDERARHVFGGMCEGKSHAFVRGFVDGVAEFWNAERDRG